MLPRVIPVLLLDNGGLFKTTAFRDPVYLGDPINTVRIFNDKSCDELMMLDVSATAEHREPDYELIAQVAGECFMPLCYGGGVRTLAQFNKLFSIGVEKVAVNNTALGNPRLLREAAAEFGCQSVVVVIDYQKRFGRKARVFGDRGRQATKWEPIQYARFLEEQGVGEIVLQAIDRDGSMRGYDIPMVRAVVDAVKMPVVACGGAGNVDDIVSVLRDGRAGAAAGGSMFVFQGPHRAVLISYPDKAGIEERVSAKIKEISR
jgi:cyclase